MVLLSQYAVADTIVLKNGNRIETQGTWEENGRVKYFKDGVISAGIPKQEIERIETGSGTTAPETTEGQSAAPVVNLNAPLLEKLNPKNSIEKAGYATVSIRTTVGSGSGFFVSTDGFLLTNKHVIKGDEKKIEEMAQQLLAAKAQIKSAASALKKERRRIEDLEKKIKSDRRYNNPNNIEVLTDAKRRYRSNTAIYKKQKSLVEKNNNAFLSLKTKLLVQQTVTIILFDQTELKATIEKISEDKDLALLRLSGYQTPFIPVGNVQSVAQGDRLYAIGNPLNFSHSVSAGVFSGHQRGMLMTSAPINAGNSGGPLVTEDGEVVGINTMKIVGRGVEGIGFAISIHTAIDEFKNELEKHMKSNP